MHALLCVDGGPTIGYGHLMRMRALMEALQAAGHQVHVATATPAPARSVLPDAVTIHPLSTRDDPVPLLACIDRCGRHRRVPRRHGVSAGDVYGNFGLEISRHYILQLIIWILQDIPTN